MALFGAQPEGTGPYHPSFTWPPPVLQFANVQRVHCTLCALADGKMTSVAAFRIV